MVGAGLLGLGRGLRAAFIVLPSRVLDHPIVRRVVAGGPFRFAWRWLLKPSIPTAIGWGALTAGGLDGEAAAWLAAASFLAAILVLNSRAGRDLEEAVVEGFGRGWHRLRSDLLPGLYRLVMGSFDRLLDAVERALYSVDEWLRFRSGEGRASLAIKVVLAATWSVVTYVVRFAINLLAEPQLNPIKHFPVVTVSHKVIAPIILLQMPPLLMAALGMDAVTANGIAWSTQLLLPGVFGFLVWELKENWKLYEANRSRLLRPVMIGHHGETMPRLLRPGFHSGTVPKLFDRLRRADRRARRSGAGVAAHRPRESLHHVEASVRHFIERELLELLRAVPRSRRPGSPPARSTWRRTGSPSACSATTAPAARRPSPSKNGRVVWWRAWPILAGSPGSMVPGDGRWRRRWRACTRWRAWTWFESRSTPASDPRPPNWPKPGSSPGPATAREPRRSMTSATARTSPPAPRSMACRPSTPAAPRSATCR